MATKLQTTEDDEVSLDVGYKRMAADDNRKREAIDWAEAALADVGDVASSRVEGRALSISAENPAAGRVSDGHSWPTVAYAFGS